MKGLLVMGMIAMTCAMPVKFTLGKVGVPKLASNEAKAAQAQRAPSAQLRQQQIHRQAYEKQLREQYEIRRSNAFDELD